jgi:beta-galactosidase/beta-glucuronidase
MKRCLVIYSGLFMLAGIISAQNTQWKYIGDKIVTQWAEKVNPENPLPEYPRPQMVRSEWKSLNGLWEYAITPVTDVIPKEFQGKILVPFAVESALSGVKRTVGVDSVLWYRTKFTVPPAMKGKNILLHFGAVDWAADIYINGIKIGSHQGGYDPFNFDITASLKGGGQYLLELRVADPTDRGPQPRGKQVRNPRGIWYTSVTGIWQTVWLEGVPKTFISSTRQTPDIDKQSLIIDAKVENPESGDVIKISAWDGNKMVFEKESAVNSVITLQVGNPKLWSPDNPFLYDLKLTVIRKGKVIDEIKSYFAMRKISMKADNNGILRMMLNNNFVFQYGTLDQGWWPDGLYTAPTDEALAFDVQKTKDFGFNMIRKHVKVEPARWYYHCDRIGMVVWQDMPSGDNRGSKWIRNPESEVDGDMTRTEASEKIYRTEWNAIIDYLYNAPCIIAWVPFNEAWGQFKTAEITNWTITKDPSRLVNQGSGGNFHKAGHILDLHNYPGPVMPKPEVFGSQQTLALGEFGGLGLPLEGHTWLNRNNWGYRTFQTADTLLMTYSGYLNQIIPFIEKGLSAAIYTQTTDVEVETNGLMTYDRKVIKMPESQMKAASQKLYDTAKKIIIK